MQAQQIADLRKQLASCRTDPASGQRVDEHINKLISTMKSEHEDMLHRHLADLQTEYHRMVSTKARTSLDTHRGSGVETPTRCWSK